MSPLGTISITKWLLMVATATAWGCTSENSDGEPQDEASNCDASCPTAAGCVEDACDEPANSSPMAGSNGGAPNGVDSSDSGGSANSGNSAGSGGMSDGTAGSGSSANGGGAAGSGGKNTGGANPSEPSTGGSNAGGANSGGANTGGLATGGSSGASHSGGMGGSGVAGSGGGAGVGEGPCDIYAAAGTPCVAAYSTVRALSSSYTGPLYQVRSGSSAENTGTGGELHDIGMTADGFANAAAQDAACAESVCTVSLLYDQSGNGNHLAVGKAGSAAGGEFAGEDDFESIADAGPLTIAEHDVYSLYMEARQGYRLVEGAAVPKGEESQSIYMLADGTHYGTQCCWSFGNGGDPQSFDGTSSLFLGEAFWGKGDGNGPWFLAEFDPGAWAGGSSPGDAGWGEISAPGPANTDNPSLPFPFALGFLKTSSTEWSLRMADTATARSVTTAYAGALPKLLYHAGGIVLGVGAANANNSWGTFYEGAIVAGYPEDVTEDAILQNIQAAHYGR